MTGVIYDEYHKKPFMLIIVVPLTVPLTSVIQIIIIEFSLHLETEKISIFYAEFYVLTLVCFPH
jgi:hypothetical protein